MWWIWAQHGPHSKILERRREERRERSKGDQEMPTYAAEAVWWYSFQSIRIHKKLGRNAASYTFWIKPPLWEHISKYFYEQTGTHDFRQVASHIAACLSRHALQAIVQLMHIKCPSCLHIAAILELLFHMEKVQRPGQNQHRRVTLSLCPKLLLGATYSHFLHTKFKERRACPPTPPFLSPPLLSPPLLSPPLPSEHVSFLKSGKVTSFSATLSFQRASWSWRTQLRMFSFDL